MNRNQTEVFEDTFRPLATAAVGSGALVLAILGFTGEAWGSLPPDAQDLVASAARAAFMTFTLLAGLSGLSFLVQGRTGPALVALVNLASVVLFIGSVFVCGLVVSRALAVGRPAAAPPEPVAVLLAAGVMGAGLLALVLVLNWLFGATRQALFRPSPQETPDD